MKRLLLFSACLLLAAGAWWFRSFLFPAYPSRRLSEGTRMVASPSGTNLAVEEREGTWGVYDGAGRRIAGFRSPALPVWVTRREEGGEDLLFYTTAEGAVRGMGFEGGLRLLDLQVDSLLSGGRFRSILLVQAAGPERVLLAAGGGGGARSYLVAAVPGGDAPFRAAPLPLPPVKGRELLSVRADPSGRRIAVVAAVPEGGDRVLLVFEEADAPRAWREVLRLESIASSRLTWSGKGRYLLFASPGGGAEVYDFRENQRRWVREIPPSFAGGPAFGGVFDAGEARLFLVVPDDQGYLQITSVELRTGKETFFSSGWADHFGPALSRDGRYIAYRQADLRERSARSGGGDLGEEEVYLWDFRGKRAYLLGRRTVSFRAGEVGPVFSGDGRFVYCVMDGTVFRYPVAGE